MENKQKEIKQQETNKESFAKKVGQYITTILLAVVLALGFRTYVFARVTVSGQSMQDTLHNNDSLFIEKVSAETHNIKRGQIIVFDSKTMNDSNFIKRVIGVEGDIVEIKDGKVYLNGKVLQEDYLSPGTVTETNSPTTRVVVPKNHVFVLGDNRGNSMDSRTLGPIDINNIVGHAVLRVYPLKNIKIF
ncbi:MAG: signal peptidase I [Bacillota bacterium]|nr:signal peptidase I [Bacillota bacterium]